jgi:hypothetical protein
VVEQSVTYEVMEVAMVAGEKFSGRWTPGKKGLESGHD